VRRLIDDEVETALAAAVRYARESPKPDPAAGMDYLYSAGVRPRAGSAAEPREAPAGLLRLATPIEQEG